MAIIQIKEKNMIKIDRNQVEIHGDPDANISEAALMFYEVCKKVSKQTGSSFTEIEDHIFRSAKVYPLIDAGMDLVQAVEVVGIDKDKIDLERSKMKDNLSKSDYDEIKKNQIEKGIGRW